LILALIKESTALPVEREPAALVVILLPAATASGLWGGPVAAGQEVGGSF